MCIIDQNKIARLKPLLRGLPKESVAVSIEPATRLTLLQAGISFEDEQFWPTVEQLGSPEAMQPLPGHFCNGDKLPPLLRLCGYGCRQASEAALQLLYAETQPLNANMDFLGAPLPLHLAARLGRADNCACLEHHGAHLLTLETDAWQLL